MGFESKFDTNAFFPGGAGMFIQYHDVLKPAYLYAIVKMIITDQTYGLPLFLLKDFSILSIIEWYIKRRYLNPLQQLDFMHKLDPDELNNLMQYILLNDDSIYKLSPPLNICRLFDVYRQQHMSFPVYVYSKEEEPYIAKDCENILSGIDYTYIHGDLKTAISKCNQNFTYIFSDIEMVNSASKILRGTYSHILLTRDYRYNYIDNCKTLKYDLQSLASANPVIRIGTTIAMDIRLMPNAFSNII